MSNLWIFSHNVPEVGKCSSNVNEPMYQVFSSLPIYCKLYNWKVQHYACVSACCLPKGLSVDKKLGTSIVQLFSCLIERSSTKHVVLFQLNKNNLHFNAFTNGQNFKLSLILKIILKTNLPHKYF